MNSNDIRTIEKKIGYEFADKALLERAFTHASADATATKNYQSLEFLGDSILDFVVAKRLMEINPDAHEGALTRNRAAIVSKEPLADEIDKLGLAKFLIVGKGESAESISSQTKIKSDIFESVIGAIYLDSKNIACAEKFVLSKLAPLFNGDTKHVLLKDYKTELNEFSSKHELKVEYSTLSAEGKPHEPTFVVAVKINGLECGKGEGKSKKEAEQRAAKIALEHIKK
ncbi:MAG: ribonuclease III [Clostridia bacterium]|nr:ribonuclease III [Clostridia bacterium]